MSSQYFILKPDCYQANILVDHDSHARLSGFSLAGLDDPEYYDAGVAAWIHNPTGDDRSDEVEYMSFRTTANDIYAFGCLCLEVRHNGLLFADSHSDHHSIFRSTLCNVLLRTITVTMPRIFRFFKAYHQV